MTKLQSYINCCKIIILNIINIITPDPQSAQKVELKESIPDNPELINATVVGDGFTKLFKILSYQF